MCGRAAGLRRGQTGPQVFLDADVLQARPQVRVVAQPDHQGELSERRGVEQPRGVQQLDAQRVGGEVRLSWEPAEGARFYAVYRVAGEGDDPCDLAGADNLLAVTGAGEAPAFTDTDPVEGPVRYHVTALDDYRAESAPSPEARLSSR